MAGFLTNSHIWRDTIFVDHQSNYVFVHLMRDLTLDKALLAKTFFERHAAKGGITIKAYRADNGCFADNGFKDSVLESNHCITYFEFGAHHQNVIVK